MTDNSRPGNPQIILRLPPEIGKPLLRMSKKKQISVQTIILEIVAESLGVHSEPPKRGRQAKEQTK